MARKVKKYEETAPESHRTKRAAPARTPEGRENQMIALAEQLAEEQLRN